MGEQKPARKTKNFIILQAGETRGGITFNEKGGEKWTSEQEKKKSKDMKKGGGKGAFWRQKRGTIDREKFQKVLHGRSRCTRDNSATRTLRKKERGDDKKKVKASYYEKLFTRKSREI